MTDTEQDYLSLKEVAAITGVSVRRLQQMVRGYWWFDMKNKRRIWYDPAVPSKRIGRKYLIKREDLALVENRRRPGGYMRSSDGVQS
jgi:Helix-turn-helix domain